MAAERSFTNHREACRRLDDGIVAGVVVLLVLAPLFVGSVNRWSGEFLLAGCAALFALWGLRSALAGAVVVRRSLSWWFVAGFLALGLLQTVPLPANFVAALSPAGETLRKAAQDAPFLLEGGREEGASARISLALGATRAELRRLLAFALMAWVVANSARRRVHVSVLTFAVVAIAAFEALYGLGELFWGDRRLLWMPRTDLRNALAAAGTFVNKNHFCGFVGMAFLLAIGAWLGARGARGESAAPGPPGTWRTQLAVAVSTPRGLGRAFLVVALVLLAFGVLFSLSRAGVVLVLLSTAALMVWSAAERGMRTRSLALLVGGVGIAALAAGIGLGPLASRFQSVAVGDDTSLAERILMVRMGFQYLMDYPLLGSGVGTCKWVVFGYQGAFFGDIWVDYLHNDWLQIACEAGIVGLLMAVGAAIAVVVEVAKASNRMQDASRRWIARGALAATGYMLLHSFFDFNLSKITSNGLLFAALVGLALGSTSPSNGEEEGRKKALLVLPLRTVWTRSGMAIVGVLVFASLVPTCWSHARADYNLGLYLRSVGRAGPYYLPLWPDKQRSVNRTTGRRALDKALELTPDHAMTHYWKGRDTLQAARADTRQAARERIAEVLGLDDATNLREASYEQALPAFLPAVHRRMQAEWRRTIPGALGHLRRAARGIPSYPWSYNHGAEARLLLLDEPVGPAVELARLAMARAPRKPAVCARSGVVLLRSVLREARSREELERGIERRADATAEMDLQAWLVSDGLEGAVSRSHRLGYGLQAVSRALAGNPEWAEDIYPVLRVFSNRPAFLAETTPDTIRAQYELYKHFRRHGDAVPALDALEVIERLALERVDKPIRTGRSTSARVGRLEASDAGLQSLDLRVPQRILADSLEKQAEIESELGRFPSVERSLRELRAARRTLLAQQWDRIRRRRQSGGAGQAFRQATTLLRQDWWFTPARVTAAEMADLPEVRGAPSVFQNPLDHVFRAILWHMPALSRPELRGDGATSTPLIRPMKDDFARRLTHVLEASKRAGSSLNLELCAALLPALSKTATEAAWSESADRLDAIAADHADSLAHHRLGPLVPFFAGVLREQMGDHAGAASAYLRTAELCPSHLPALLRLRFLRKEHDTGGMPQKTGAVGRRIDDLLPDQPVGRTFGGRVAFLGCEVRTSETESDGGEAEIVYFWMPLDRFHQRYLVWIRLLGPAGRTIEHEGHALHAPSGRVVNETACPGAVCVVRTPLTAPFRASSAMQVGLLASQPGALQGEWLLSDTGERTVRIPTPKPLP